MKRHAPVEISDMLRQAAEMMNGGMSQKDVCRSLGVSVMTFHRWRKRAPLNEASTAPLHEHSNGSSGPDPVEELRLENHRLRRIVSDLLLEKVKIEEALEKAKK